MADGRWCTPTAMNNPPENKGNMRYRVENVEAATGALLQTAVNAFLDSLIGPGLPWAHLVAINYDVSSTVHHAMVVYLVTNS